MSRSAAMPEGLCYDSATTAPPPYRHAAHAAEPCRYTAMGLSDGEEIKVFRLLHGQSFLVATLTPESPGFGPVFKDACFEFMVPGDFANRVFIECCCGEEARPFDGADTLSDMLACLEAMKELIVADNKPLIVQGLAHSETCMPVWVEYPCTDNRGYDYSAGVAYTINPDTGEAQETALSASFNPGAQPDMQTDKEDLTPLTIVGPAAAAAASAIFADALAASTVTDFSLEGSAITEADVAECGTMNIATKDGRPGIAINGDTANPVASWSDPDGVNMANTFEVLDGCEALVMFCAIKKFVPPKA